VLELLGGDQVLQDAQALFRDRAASGFFSGSMRCCSQCFCSGTWMFMYSQPILAAVGVTKGFEDLPQRGDGLVIAFADGRAEAAGDELAVQVPRW